MRRARVNRPRAQHAWLITVAEHLAMRGLEICARDLGRREPLEVIRAFCWAATEEPPSRMPEWLRAFVRTPLPEPTAPMPWLAPQLQLPLEERTRP